MQWNNGRIHGDITVGGKVYSTDHKHVAIFGTKDYTGFGELGINSYMYGKDVGIKANNQFHVDSVAGSSIRSDKYVNINGVSGITIGSSSYGPTLPSTGVEGQIFFKLIS